MQGRYITMIPLVATTLGALVAVAEEIPEAIPFTSYEGKEQIWMEGPFGWTTWFDKDEDSAMS